MQSKPKTVEQYLASLPDDRREALEALRKVIKKNLGKGFEEGIQYGMIGYYVPHSVYPAGYHCDPKQPLPFASLASQKKHIGIYLFCIYGAEGEQNRFREEWEKTGKKLDMGKSCVRVKKLDDVPLPLIGKTIKQMTLKKFLAHYEGAMMPGSKRTPAKSKAKKSGAEKKVATKKAPAKKKAAKKVPATKKAVKKKAAKKVSAKKKAAKKPVKRRRA